eukprot:symbB.v1.2.005684.t1/scaffold334.1/size226555/7
MEFLEMLINTLVEGESQPESLLSRATSDAFRQLLGGFLQTHLHCPRRACQKRWSKADPIFSIKLPSQSSGRSEQDSFSVIVVSQPSSQRPIVEHRVSLSKPVTACMLLDAAAEKAQVERHLCIGGILENGRLRMFQEEQQLQVGEVPFLIYELEDEDAIGAFWEAASSGAKDCKDESERRICPDDGKLYTFRELLAAYSSQYSPEDLGDYWRDAMASELVIEGKKSPVVVHVRVSWNFGRKLVGVPLLFCMDTKTHMEKLINAIQVQLMLRYNLDANDWTLFQTSAGWDAALAETQLIALGEETQPLTLRGCEHLVVHWDFPPISLLSSSIRSASGLSAPVEESLVSCFQWLTETEQLDEDNGLWCDGCHQKVQAFSHVSLAMLPPVLMLQLKRFDFKYGQRHRLNHAVTFPLEGLDLSPFCSTPEMIETLLQSESTKSEHDDFDIKTALKQRGAIYDLLGTITHSGTALFGHYRAFVRSCADGQWYLYNDDLVRSASKEEVLKDTQGTYVLFYISRPAALCVDFGSMELGKALLDLRIRLDSEGAAQVVWSLWRMGRFHDAWVLFVRTLSDGRHPEHGKTGFTKKHAVDGRQRYYQTLLMETEKRGDVQKQVFLWKQMAADFFSRNLRTACLNCAVPKTVS